jgi:hypothetical protein
MNKVKNIRIGVKLKDLNPSLEKHGYNKIMLYMYTTEIESIIANVLYSDEDENEENKRILYCGEITKIPESLIDVIMGEFGTTIVLQKTPYVILVAQPKNSMEIKEVFEFLNPTKKYCAIVKSK